MLINALSPWPTLNTVSYGLPRVESDQGSIEAASLQPSTQPSSAAGSQNQSSAVTPAPDNDKSDGQKKPENAQKPKAGSKSISDLTSQEKAEVVKLQQRDSEVKAHEQAHIAAGGQYVRGGARYQYQKGPDGKMYAVGGEVAIGGGGGDGGGDSERGLEATIERAQTIRQAALAPANPSGQDRKVAAQASQEEAEARSELTKVKMQKATQAAEGKSETQGTRETSEGKAKTQESTQDTEGRAETKESKQIAGEDPGQAGAKDHSPMPTLASIQAYTTDSLTQANKSRTYNPVPASQIDAMV